MRSKMIGLVVVAFGVLAAVPAFADDKPSFPMPAATFKQRVDARQAKAREHMEKRASKLTAEQAKELRAKFEANIAKVNAEVAKAIADGTVTKDEAAAVRAASPHRGGHAGGGHCDKGKPGA
ncbi:MAG: hypothetical protein KIT84_19755 [Labilithrix sp.]|nr:hypothetical protein [Labilithrix sp.]MCW5813273.1 hypothetical protein [Labilithrix sp.]